MLLYPQARGGPPSVDAPPRQHPAGFAPPAAAVRPESLRRPGAWAAKPGSAAAQVPYHHLQVCTEKKGFSLYCSVAGTPKQVIDKLTVVLFCVCLCVCMIGCFWKEPVQRGGDWHLLLHQSHHQHDNTLYSAGLTPLFVFALWSFSLLTYSFWRNTLWMQRWHLCHSAIWQQKKEICGDKFLKLNC